MIWVIAWAGASGSIIHDGYCLVVDDSLRSKPFLGNRKTPNALMIPSWMHAYPAQREKKGGFMLLETRYWFLHAVVSDVFFFFISSHRVQFFSLIFQMLPVLHGTTVLCGVLDLPPRSVCTGQTVCIRPLPILVLAITLEGECARLTIGISVVIRCPPPMIDVLIPVCVC